MLYDEIPIALAIIFAILLVYAALTWPSYKRRMIAKFSDEIEEYRRKNPPKG